MNAITVPAFTIDWHHDSRSAWAVAHDRFRQEMDIALLAAHVRLLDLDSLYAAEEDEAPVCRCCDGRGWFMATDDRRPWRETKQECWECQ